MRSLKDSSANDKWLLLTPMVNSCKLHLTVKSPGPDGAQRMVDSQGSIKGKCINTTPVFQHSHSVAATAQSGLDSVSHARDDKPRRPSHSAKTISCSDALHLSKRADKYGVPGGYKYNTVPGTFPFHNSASGFQRIDLDRRCLEECPQLGLMDELQLLNLQHNLIPAIQHLSHLQQLVVLNLTDNHITEMTGIETLISLKILLLGQNRIQQISCLERLSNLNILDLHNNQIYKAENVCHLRELRVLNLAGNHISRVEKLQGLDQLTELNLRHNCISVLSQRR